MNEEQILGVIPNVKSGVFGQKMYNLVATDKGIIVAQLTSSMIKEESKRVSDELKEQGAGRLKRMGATMTAGINLYKRYFSMPVADIIAETNGNFSIDRNRVKSIKIRRDSSNEDINSHELIIKWSGGKSKFNFSDVSPKVVKDLLRQTFGDMVR
ncbi:MAG: hypothetical protein DRN33_00310 [Thermoplasmata archaeon]|jgi:hypothetical protein|nr:MAG: hypothetical protein DRN33_00310 [Thermoplasmata archaeon]